MEVVFGLVNFVDDVAGIGTMEVVFGLVVVLAGNKVVELTLVLVNDTG
jgi:hypothetical protein